MRNKNFFTASALTIAFMVPTLHAGDNYVGGGVAQIDYSESIGISGEASLTTLFGKFGRRLNENISAEVRFGFGLGDDSVNVAGTDVDIKLKNLSGVYIKAGVPLSDKLYSYLIVGYTRAEAEVSNFGSASETDVSFGLGADFSVSETIDITLEYISYFDKDGVELSGFGVSASKAF